MLVGIYIGQFFFKVNNIPDSMHLFMWLYYFPQSFIIMLQAAQKIVGTDRQSETYMYTVCNFPPQTMFVGV